MVLSTASKTSDDIRILISGGDEQSYETLKSSLLTQWMFSSYHRVSGPKEMLEFLLQSDGSKSAPQPDLIFLLFSGEDDGQIELLHDLCMVLIEKKIKNIIAVLTGRNTGVDPGDHFRLVGADLVMHIDDIISKNQEIKDLIIGGWFRT